MSERYESGIDYYEADTRFERELEKTQMRPVMFLSLAEYSQKLRRMDAEFYRDINDTIAMKMAIAAMDNYLKKQKEKVSK
jgi:aspartokinase-like uncharacterized kinase